MIKRIRILIQAHRLHDVFFKTNLLPSNVLKAFIDRFPKYNNFLYSMKAAQQFAGVSTNSVKWLHLGKNIRIRVNKIENRESLQ